MGRDLGREVYFNGKNNNIKKTLDDKYDGSVKSLVNITRPYLRIGGNFLQVYKNFHHYRDEIRQLYTCRASLMEKVHLYAKKLIKRDFVEFYLQETTKKFLLPALNFSLNHLKKTQFMNISLLFIGDDANFVKNLTLHHLRISNSYIAEGLSPGGDMCLAINFCNSFLLSSSGSTFGWWMAYLLSDKAPVFFNSKITKSGKKYGKSRWEEDIYLKEWIAINVNNGQAYQEIKSWQNNQSIIL
uniref:Alpha-1,2-fucosyltransferase n=1 Tax=Acrobeloides nanus TaxID=290746 RepID=A0A914CI43_9BILA